MKRLSAAAAHRPDAGAALVLVIGIVAVVTTLTLTVATMSINNFRNAVRDKQAGSALATSEAGVAEAIEYIRSGVASLGTLTCLEADIANTCQGSTMSWTSEANPMEVPVDGGVGPCTAAQTCFKVWISAVKSYAPPLVKSGTYRIRSTGAFGDGPATRRVAVDVVAKPFPFPIGIFAESLDGSGGAGIHRESLFTRDCISGRVSDTDNGNGGGLRFGGDVDLAYDIPPAAHSTEAISTGQCNQTGNYVHQPGQPCNDTLPDYYDQSGTGAGLTPGDNCYERWTSPNLREDGTRNKYPTTSKFTLQDLQAVGYRPRGLSDKVYEDLKARAVAQGTYFTDKNANPHTALSALGGAQGVLYYKIGSSEKVTLGPTSIPAAYLRQESDNTSCGGSSLIIIVEGGSLSLNSIGSGNSTPVTGLVANIFVPNGSYDGAGGVWVIGTLFAQQVKLSGTSDFRLDKCFVSNPPNALLDISVVKFREDDTDDIS